MVGQFFDSEVSAQNGQDLTTLIVIGAPDQSHQLIAVSEYPKMGIQCLVELRIVDSNHSPTHVGELLPLVVGLDTANNFRRPVTNIGCVHNASGLFSH
jgi:hypothetical protein